jgi:hypothetical protein
LDNQPGDKDHQADEQQRHQRQPRNDRDDKGQIGTNRGTDRDSEYNPSEGSPGPALLQPNHTAREAAEDTAEDPPCPPQRLALLHCILLRSWPVVAGRWNPARLSLSTPEHQSHFEGVPQVLVRGQDTEGIAMLAAGAAGDRPGKDITSLALGLGDEGGQRKPVHDQV